ncbi:hypothetical protein SteCoe_39608 [Stentor coeruleus]|uniref:Uncharacterized protein n=1 Tax=Stentor coeruleus TaxID=5963 RepID=A0A1R2AKJ3_9CILI|nr:hypothetical protein SteCoe_39608 [Stentor coeruleus]
MVSCSASTGYSSDYIRQRRDHPCSTGALSRPVHGLLPCRCLGALYARISGVAIPRQSGWPCGGLRRMGWRYAGGALCLPAGAGPLRRAADPRTAVAEHRHPSRLSGTGAVQPAGPHVLRRRHRARLRRRVWCGQCQQHAGLHPQAGLPAGASAGSARGTGPRAAHGEPAPAIVRATLERRCAGMALRQSE